MGWARWSASACSPRRRCAALPRLHALRPPRSPVGDARRRDPRPALRSATGRTLRGAAAARSPRHTPASPRRSPVGGRRRAAITRRLRCAGRVRRRPPASANCVFMPAPAGKRPVLAGSHRPLPRSGFAPAPSWSLRAYGRQGRHTQIAADRPGVVLPVPVLLAAAKSPPRRPRGGGVGDAPVGSKPARLLVAHVPPRQGKPPVPPLFPLAADGSPHPP